MMKKILMLATLLVLFSCKTDEDPTPWIGTWKYRATIIKKADDPTFILPSKEITHCEEQDKIVFTDRTYISYSNVMQKDSTCLETVVEVPYTITVTQEAGRNRYGKLNFSLGGKSYEFDITAGMIALDLVHRSGDSIIQQVYRRQ